MSVIIIKSIYYFFLCLALLLSLHDKNSKDPTLRILPWLLSLGLCTQILEGILEESGKMHTIVFHFYNLFEFPLYAVYFYLLMYSGGLRRTLGICVLSYILFFIYYFSQVRSLHVEAFSSLTAVEGVLMTTFSLYFFYRLLRSDNYYNLSVYPHFYINAANLIFFSLSLLAMSFDAYLQTVNPAAAKKVLYINMFSNVLMYILYSYGLAINIWRRKISS